MLKHDIIKFKFRFGSQSGLRGAANNYFIPRSEFALLTGAVKPPFSLNGDKGPQFPFGV